jgi:hypothetical protein
MPVTIENDTIRFGISLFSWIVSATMTVREAIALF